MLFNKKQNNPEQDEVLEQDRIYQQGIATVRGLIAPSAIQIESSKIHVGDTLATTIFVVAYPRYLNNNWFSPIINIDFPMDTAMFIHPAQTHIVLKNLRKSATRLQSQIDLEARGGKVRDPILESALENVEDLRDRLQQGTERFFRFGLYMTFYGADEKQLNSHKTDVMTILEAQLVYTKSATLRTDLGFISTLPLAEDALDNGTNLNTAPLSTMFPFVSSTLSSNDGILYGVNRHNNSLILFDRFNLENANMTVFAKSGGGKSYFVKLEILRSMMFGTHVIVIDPENEYQHLCQTIGGTFINISLGSKAHLNPFELPDVPDDERPEDVFRNTIASLIGLLHIMLGTISPEEDTVLERAIRESYAVRDIRETAKFDNIAHEDFPTMSDLKEILESMEGGEVLAQRLEKFTDGIFAEFLNKPTNVEVDNQMVVFNIRDLEDELRPIAMYMVLQHIWNDMRKNLRKRIVVIDEAWMMMQNDDAASFVFSIAKRCRKYYTGLTTITQDISDFLASRHGKPIVTNSSLQLLLRQSPASIDLLQETFYLTDHEKFLLLESGVGEGIFFAGPKHAAIKVIASYSEDQIITSNPEQILAQKNNQSDT